MADQSSYSPVGAMVERNHPNVPWLRVAVAIGVVMVLLALLPGRTSIAPLVESDYCYQLIAADRLLAGKGLTAPQPVAPGQPWSWTFDWGFLTKWPIGYSLLVWVVRRLSGIGSIEACRWISTTACAAALVGWFTLARQCVPRSVTGLLLSAVAAGSSVSVALLTNPSTDLLLVAQLPFVLLLIIQALNLGQATKTPSSRTKAALAFALAGFLSGGLFWIRYASLFVPTAAGAYLLIECLGRRRVSARHVLLYGIGSALPIAILLAINHSYGPAESMQSRLNLGTSVGLDLSWHTILAAWRGFTDLGFYDYHPSSRWAYALGPVAILVVTLLVPTVRFRCRVFWANPATLLCAAVATVFLGMIVLATALFGGKFRYVDLDRYYLPVRPLYFLLFVAPLLHFPRRLLRVGACIVLLVMGSWIVQQDWRRAHVRALATHRPTTPRGAWSRCFEPGATALYEWLARQEGSDLIWVSNFHEYVALETGIPALPIPADVDSLDAWIARICAARGITEPRVIFVLDPSNHWRDSWIGHPDEIVARFHLTRRADLPRAVSAGVYDYTQRRIARIKNKRVPSFFRTATVRERWVACPSPPTAGAGMLGYRMAALRLTMPPEKVAALEH